MFIYIVTTNQEKHMGCASDAENSHVDKRDGMNAYNVSFKTLLICLALDSGLSDWMVDGSLRDGQSQAS